MKTVLAIQRTILHHYFRAGNRRKSEVNIQPVEGNILEGMDVMLRCVHTQFMVLMVELTHRRRASETERKTGYVFITLRTCRHASGTGGFHNFLQYRDIQGECLHTLNNLLIFTDRALDLSNGTSLFLILQARMANSVQTRQEARKRLEIEVILVDEIPSGQFELAVTRRAAYVFHK